MQCHITHQWISLGKVLVRLVILDLSTTSYNQINKSSTTKTNTITTKVSGCVCVGAHPYDRQKHILGELTNQELPWCDGYQKNWSSLKYWIEIRLWKLWSRIKILFWSTTFVRGSIGKDIIKEGATKTVCIKLITLNSQNVISWVE